MSTATLSLGYRAISRKVSSFHFIKINWKLIYILCAILSFVMLVSYIYMVNQLTQGAYLIKKYNKEIVTLLNENKTLEAHFAESGFLGDVQARARQLSFEKTTGVVYIKMAQNSLAEAK